MVQHSAIDHTGITGTGSGSNPISYALLTSQHDNSTTSYTDVTGLSFALAADASYFVEYFLRVNTNATSVGIKLALNAAQATTSIALTGLVPSNAAGLNTQFAAGFTFSKDTESFTMTTGPGGTNTLCVLLARVVTVTNADTLQLRHASETASLTSIINGFSIGRCTKIT
jgi:hypothetical protein